MSAPVSGRPPDEEDAEQRSCRARGSRSRRAARSDDLGDEDPDRDEAPPGSAHADVRQQVPPVEDSRNAPHAPRQRERPRDRPHPARQEGERNKEAADRPGPDTRSSTPRAMRAMTRRDRHQEAERADREDRRRDRRRRRRTGARSDRDPGPKRPRGRRRHAVDPDRQGRERRGRRTSENVTGADNEQLERSEQRSRWSATACRDARRRPDPHDRSAERCVRRGHSDRPLPEHEERDGREEERPEDREDAVERGARQAASRSAATQPGACGEFRLTSAPGLRSGGSEPPSSAGRHTRSPVAKADQHLGPDEARHRAERLAVGQPRAASIACVNGSHPDSVAIQSGSSEIGMFAPVKMSRNPKMTFESTAFSRIRSESAALISPSPVHEKAATRITRASAGTDETRDVDAENEAPDRSEKAATNAPFEDDGQRAPEEERDAARRADEDRAQACSGSARLRSCCVMANRHGIAAYWSAFPSR